MRLASGEFSADEYGKSGEDDMSNITPVIIFIIIIVILMFMRSNGGRNQRHISDKGLPLWMLLSMMNSGRGSHTGSWGGFQVVAIAEDSEDLAAAVSEVAGLPGGW